MRHETEERDLTLNLHAMHLKGDLREVHCSSKKRRKEKKRKKKEKKSIKKERKKKKRKKQNLEREAEDEENGGDEGGRPHENQVDGVVIGKNSTYGIDLDHRHHSTKVHRLKHHGFMSIDFEQ